MNILESQPEIRKPESEKNILKVHFQVRKFTFSFKKNNYFQPWKMKNPVVIASNLLIASQLILIMPGKALNLNFRTELR